MRRICQLFIVEPMATGLAPATRAARKIVLILLTVRERGERIKSCV
jgi:hypothetical protein